MIDKHRAAEEREARSEYLWIYGPGILLALVALFVTYQFVDPAPPSRLVIATGDPMGAYHAFSQRYREILARDGVELELRSTAGSVENIALIEAGEVDVALVQGGTGKAARGERLRSLASLYYEPLWLFHRADVEVERLADLAGRRLAIGPAGSGTRYVAMELLADNGLGEGELTLSDLGGGAALDALQARKIDALVMVAAFSSSHVRHAMRVPDIRLMSFARAQAYTRLHHFLHAVTMPEGVADLRRNLPRRDVSLLAPTANMVATEALHPALVGLLLEAATEVHGSGGMFETEGEFPSRRFVEFPLHPEAKRHFERGPPFLRRALPFWAANLVDRLAVMLVPLIALVIPLMRVMPPLYRWRVRRRVYRWYKELRAIEREIREGVTSDRFDEIVARLDEVESEVRKVSIPWAYADELYQLRVHIQYVRDNLVATPESGAADDPRQAAAGGR
ncbi:MAG: TAXI family TRAP transporter solute-binding subunit [Gammaproteobacteria bacterium]|nr:TAXI family TRAP transporter solute-binding subunit [Gammaproteobacteria bacterium]